ncbi:MAG: hypothetical protein R3F03_03105 [Opitutaceae bacterium]
MIKEVIKYFVVAGWYLVLPPLLAFVLKGRRRYQRWVMGAMIFITSIHITKFTVMLGSIEWYRGHTKGFEASLLVGLSLALLLAGAWEKAKGFRWVPPGLGWWWLYCAVSVVSIFAAPNQVYVLMAATKFFSVGVILAAAYNFLCDEEDLRWVLRCIAVTLAVQAAVVLKMKYLDGFYQVRGWFEHQNPLAMWAYMLGLPLLAAAMAKVSRRDGRWYIAGFLAAAIIVQSALSRAALAVFAAGVMAVLVAGLMDGVTARRVRTILVLGFVGMLGLAATADTIIARFNDHGNQASGETRDVMNLASAAMLRDSAIGLGWNNFALTINRPYPYGDVIDDWERDRGHKVDEDYAKGVVESHYWLLLAETGYGGFVTYLLMIGVVQWWAVRGAWLRRGTLAGVFLAAVAIGFGLTYVHSDLERVLTQTKNLSMWMILVGCVARLEAQRKGRP